MPSEKSVPVADSLPILVDDELEIDVDQNNFEKEADETVESGES